MCTPHISSIRRRVVDPFNHNTTLPHSVNIDVYPRATILPQSSLLNHSRIDPHLPLQQQHITRRLRNSAKLIIPLRLLQRHPHTHIHTPRERHIQKEKNHLKLGQRVSFHEAVKGCSRPYRIERKRVYSAGESLAARRILADVDDVCCCWSTSSLSPSLEIDFRLFGPCQYSADLHGGDGGGAVLDMILRWRIQR